VKGGAFFRILKIKNLNSAGYFWPYGYSKSTTPKATQILLRIKNSKNEI